MKQLSENMSLTFVKTMHRTFITVLLLTACGSGVNAGEYYFRHLNQRYSELHTLLIVDDNEDLLDFMRNYLDKCYNIIMAHDGEEALGIAHSENVEIIISDVMMPKIDGGEHTDAERGNDDNEL